MPPLKSSGGWNGLPVCGLTITPGWIHSSVTIALVAAARPTAVNVGGVKFRNPGTSGGTLAQVTISIWAGV